MKIAGIRHFPTVKHSNPEKTELRQDVKEFFNFKTSDLSTECNCHQEFRVHICFVHEGPEVMNRIKVQLVRAVSR